MNCIIKVQVQWQQCVEYLQWYQHYQWTQVSPHFPKICFLDFQINQSSRLESACWSLHSFSCYMLAMLLRLRMWMGIRRSKYMLPLAHTSGSTFKKYLVRSFLTSLVICLGKFWIFLFFDLSRSLKAAQLNDIVNINISAL